MMRHSTERKFLCHACGAKFKTKATQKRHYATVHATQKRVYACRKCGKSFHVRATLLRHQRMECKRKPRKDAFGLVVERQQQEITALSHQQEITGTPLSIYTSTTADTSKYNNVYKYFLNSLFFHIEKENKFK